MSEVSRPVACAPEMAKGAVAFRHLYTYTYTLQLRSRQIMRKLTNVQALPSSLKSDPSHWLRSIARATLPFDAMRRDAVRCDAMRCCAMRDLKKVCHSNEWHAAAAVHSNSPANGCGCGCKSSRSLVSPRLTFSLLFQKQTNNEKKST